MIKNVPLFTPMRTYWVVGLRHFIKFPVLIMLLLLSSSLSRAQITVTTPYPVAAQQLTRGLDSSLLTVEVNFLSACTGNVCTITLPGGVTYVAGSVSAIAASTTTGFTIAALGGTPGIPTFTIGGVAGPGSIRFTIKRTAGCGAAASGKDAITVTGSCGSVTEADANVNSYNLLSPALAITPPPAITNAVVGSTATRTTTITNGGNGALDTLRFYIVYPGGGIVNTTGTNAITANGVSFTPSSTNGDTLFYKIYGTTIFGGNNLLSNGETVTISEPIRVIKCNTTTVYGTSWGNKCQIATATSAVTMAVGVPNFTTTITEPVVVGACTTGNVVITITNTGSGGNAGALYNLLAKIGNTDPNVPAVVLGPTILTYNNFAINGVPVTVTQVGGNPYNVNTNQFTVDPDGVGIGLEDIDGDGQFDELAPGKSLVITCNRNYNIQPACVVPSYYYRIGTQLTYDNMCGINVVAANAIGGVVLQHTGNAVSVTTPALVAGSIPFTLRICNTGFNSTSITKPTDSTYLEMTLPAGLAYAGNGQFNGAAATVTQVGSVLYIAYKGTYSNFCYNADFLYTCGTSGTLSVPYKVYNVLDRSCNAIEYFNTCTTMGINVKCPSPCPTGMANFTPSARRINYGYADAKMTTLVNPATLTGYTIKTGMPYDTFNILVPAKQIGTYNNLYYYYQVDRAAGADVLQFISGTLNFKAGGTGATISCTMPAPDLSLSTVALTKFRWNFTSLLGGACGLPASLNNGDSVWVDMKYVVTTANNSALYGGKLTTPANGASYFYNLNAASAETYCDIWAPDIYLLGFNKSGAGNSSNPPTTISGCTPTTGGMMNYSFMNNEPGDAFPGEYRPSVVLDSVIITLPTGISWTGANINMSIDTFSTPYTRHLTTQALPATLRGNQIVLVNDGSWRMSDLTPTTFVNRLQMTFGIVANCAAAPSSIIGVASYGKSFAYAGVNIPFASINTTGPGNLTVNYNTANKPAVSVQNNTGVVQGILPQHYWDVQVNNPSTQTAPYVWLALEKSSGSSAISIDSVVLKPSNVILTPATYNTTDKWYQLNTAGLTTGGVQQARVYFKYASCSPDSVLLKSGWNCTGYPSPDPLTGYACTAAQTYLKVIPQTSQVQIEMIRQPGNGSTIAMCTEDSVTIKVNSAQAANLINPYVVIYPPAGITINTPLPVEYPLGSGIWQNVTPVSIAGGGYQINLVNHTGIGVNGLPGTVINPGAIERQAKIKIAFSANCSFVSGSQLDFFAHGNKPCGSVADGDGENVKSNPINITGATVTGSAAVGLGMPGGTTLVCGVNKTLNLSVNVLGSSTLAGDTAVYKLPAGVSYAGNFSGCACTVTIVAGPGGTTLVKIALPVGVTSGSAINFNFDVTASGIGGCGTANIDGQVERNITGLTCNGTPCGNTKIVIGTGPPVAISITKPSISITNMAFVSGSMVFGSTATVAVTYQNTGTAAATAGTYIAEFFCGTSTVPFYSTTIAAALAINASVTENVTLTFPATCPGNNFITAKVQAVTNTGVNQCICAPSSFTMLTALPIKFTGIAAQGNDCYATIAWQYELVDATVLNFEVQRSEDGVQFSTIAHTTSKSLRDAPPAAGTWYYRVKAISTSGEFSYSAIVKVKTSCTVLAGSFNVYPNPVATNATLYINYTAQKSNVNTIVRGIDAMGRILFERKVTVAQGQNNLQVKLPFLASGVYTLQLIDGIQKPSVTKFVIK